MRLIDDPEAVSWLERFSGTAQDFDWDTGNRTKQQKHGVEPEEVEAMFHAPLVFAGRIIEPAHDELRWLVLGQDQNGRRLTLVLTRRGDRLRPISCRSMRREEKDVYEEALRTQFTEKKPENEGCPGG